MVTSYQILIASVYFACYKKHIFLKVTGEVQEMSSLPNLTVWQALGVVSWFLLLTAAIGVFVWKSDPSSAIVRYVKNNLAVTITGFFAAWLAATTISILLFEHLWRR